MAVAASPKLWMVSDRRATLPDSTTTTSCKRAVAISPTKDHLMAQMPRSEVTIVGSTAPWVWPCPPCPWWWSCGCSSLWACDTGAILPLTSLFTQRRGIGILGSCPVGSCIALRLGHPSGCPGLAFITRVLLAALFCLAPVRQRGLSLCAISALRGTVGGATMTTLGGAGTLWTNLYLPRARLIGFSHRVGAPTGPPLG